MAMTSLERAEAAVAALAGVFAMAAVARIAAIGRIAVPFIFVDFAAAAIAAHAPSQAVQRTPVAEQAAIGAAAAVIAARLAGARAAVIAAAVPADGLLKARQAREQAAVWSTRVARPPARQAAASAAKHEGRNERGGKQSSHHGVASVSQSRGGR